MSGTIAKQVRGSLAASREQADQVLSSAEWQARRLSAMADANDRELAGTRLAPLGQLRAEVEMHQVRIELAYAAMAEAMARASQALTRAARDVDPSAPAGHEGIRAMLEIKLTETREMTIRVGMETTEPAALPRERRIAATVEKESR